MKTKNSFSKSSSSRALHSLVLSLILVGAISAGSAVARVVIVEVAPPPPRVEVVPVMRHGYTWAPGYWNWQHNQHVWVNGHAIRERKGYNWTPDHWTQVSHGHEYERGHWTRHVEHGQ